MGVKIPLSKPDHFNSNLQREEECVLTRHVIIALQKYIKTDPSRHKTVMSHLLLLASTFTLYIIVLFLFLNYLFFPNPSRLTTEYTKLFLRRQISI